MIAPEQQTSSTETTSLPIKHLRRSGALKGEKLLHHVATVATQQQEKAATRLQAVIRGKLVRKLNLTLLAASEQRKAIARLRARRQSTTPGRSALPAGRNILRDTKRVGARTCKC